MWEVRLTAIYMRDELKQSCKGNDEIDVLTKLMCCRKNIILSVVS